MRALKRNLDGGVTGQAQGTAWRMDGGGGGGEKERGQYGGGIKVLARHADDNEDSICRSAFSPPFPVAAVRLWRDRPPIV